MPYIIVQICYPSHVADEVREKYIEMVKEIPFDKSLGKETIPVTSNTTKNGIEVMSVVEVKQGKVEEAWKWGRKRMNRFQNVEGLEYDMRLWNTLTESLEGSEYSVPE